MRKCVIAILALLTFAPHPAKAEDTPAKTVTFQIYDEVSSPELEEVITATINHLPVADVKLGPGKTSENFNITTPAAATYSYTLCGHAKFTLADGTTKTITIDFGGSLDYLDGRTLGIFGNQPYSIFYLRDMILDAKSENKPRITAGHSCPQTVAMAE